MASGEMSSYDPIALFESSGAIVDMNNQDLSTWQHHECGPDVNHDLSNHMTISDPTTVVHHYGDPGHHTWSPTYPNQYVEDIMFNDSALDMEDTWDTNANRDDSLLDQQTNDDSAVDLSSDKALCPECNKLLCKKGVAKHISRVHKKDKYHISCPQCSKAFFSKKDLFDHISSHKELREKVFLCPDRGCPRHRKGYTRPDNALRHVKDRHPELIRLDANGDAIKGCIKWETAPYRRPTQNV